MNHAAENTRVLLASWLWLLWCDCRAFRGCWMCSPHLPFSSLDQSEPCGVPGARPRPRKQTAALMWSSLTSQGHRAVTGPLWNQPVTRTTHSSDVTSSWIRFHVLNSVDASAVVVLSCRDHVWIATLVLWVLRVLNQTCPGASVVTPKKNFTHRLHTCED